MSYFFWGVTFFVVATGDIFLHRCQFFATGDIFLHRCHFFVRTSVYKIKAGSKLICKISLKFYLLFQFLMYQWSLWYLALPISMNARSTSQFGLIQWQIITAAKMQENISTVDFPIFITHFDIRDWKKLNDLAIKLIKSKII